MIFTSLDTVKKFLNITDDNSNDILNMYIEANGVEICNRCNRDTFAKGSFTEYADGDRSFRMLLKNTPIESITSVHDDTSHQWGDNTLIDPANYTVDPWTGVLKCNLMFVFGGYQFWNNTVRIIYVGGYDTLPADLILAATQLVAADWLDTMTTINLAATQGEGGSARAKILREMGWKTVDFYRRLPYGIKTS